MESQWEPYEEKIGYSRGSLWAPFHAVGMVARIRGDVPLWLVKNALRKLQILYPPLTSRVRVEPDGSGWLTTEGVEACPLEVRPRRSEDDWLALFLEQEQLPFPIERGPVTRFFLLQGQDSADLIAVAPHVICDGSAMTQVMADAAMLLNDPERLVARPAPAAAVGWQSVAHAPTDHLLVRGALHAVNRLWPQNSAPVSQAEYEDLHRAYWQARRDGLLACELSPAQTADLVARCREHGVSVTGALVAGFLLAHLAVRPASLPSLSDVTVAANIRNRMLQPPGRVVGVYASNISLTLHPAVDSDFWTLAREAHTRVHRALDDRAKIIWPLVVGELHPFIADRMLARLSSGQMRRMLGPLARFVKIGGMNPNLDVSNIGRVELPDVGSPFRLENMLPLPPLWPGGGLALNVLTINGRMNVILKYRLDQMDSCSAASIRDRALSYLSGAS